MECYSVASFQIYRHGALLVKNFKSEPSSGRPTGPLVRVQHLLDAERGCRRAGRGGRAGVRVARRERGGLLVVHRPVHLGRELAAQHGARRRGRRHAPPRQEVQLHL